MFASAVMTALQADREYRNDCFSCQVVGENVCKLLFINLRSLTTLVD